MNIDSQVLMNSFEILSILIAIDGVKYKEIYILKEFVNKFNGEKIFDCKREIEEISNRNSHELIKNIKEPIEYIKEKTDLKFRKILMEYAVKIVSSDHEITEAEATIISLMGLVFEIDTSEYLNRYF